MQSTAVDYDLQGTGANTQLQKALIAEAKMRGYVQLSRHALTDTGYAQKLIASAQIAGTLIAPIPGEPIKYDSFHGRPQIYVVTRIE